MLHACFCGLLVPDARMVRSMDLVLHRGLGAPTPLMDRHWTCIASSRHLMQPAPTPADALCAQAADVSLLHVCVCMCTCMYVYVCVYLYVVCVCVPGRPRETQRSTVKYNDSTPRWLETFDFVMVSAGSILTITVKDKTGLVDGALSLISKVRGRPGRSCTASNTGPCASSMCHVQAAHRPSTCRQL